MAALSVQILGIENVLSAYDNKGCVKWSCWQGKAMNEFYDGDDVGEGRATLEAWLRMLSPFSSAVYTLRFHPDDVVKIRSSSEDIGGFNFRLAEDDRWPVEPVRVRSRGVDNDIIALMEKMDSRMTKLEERIGAAPEPDKLETWEKILDHPIALAACAKIFGLDAGIMQGAAIGAVGDAGSVEDSLRILMEADADFAAHLWKLAQLARSNPGQFKMLVGMLDKM